MTFRERNAWLVLIVATLAFGGYAISLVGGAGLASGSLGAIITACATFIVLIIAAHIAAAVLTRETSGVVDERDHRIADRAETIGGYVLGAIVQGIVVYAALHQQWLIANLAFFGLVLSSLVKAGTAIFLYRTSA